jgi:hypothetical protein
MPHSEIIHPQAPPAREIHRADPASHDAEAVRALGEQFKRSAETLFQSFDLESSATALKNAAARSDQYASSLSRYWSYMRESAGDTYLHKDLVGKDWHADTTWFRETNSALREIDRTLSRQLSKWEEVTSPYADKLDAVAISHACHDLRFTIDEALQKTKPEGLPGDPQSTAEYAYRLTISVALAGMSEQIGKRLEALGSGTPQPASFTRQSSNPSIHQSINPSIHQSINQSINPSISQSINQSTNQSINESINQSVNPSIHRSINP